MAEAYIVGMMLPQEQPDEEDGVSDNIDALFGDSFDGDVVVPVMTDEQVALLASFKTAHREEGTRQFMATEREALAFMLVVRANAAREAARMVTQEEAARVAEAVAELAAREEVAHATTRAEELVEEAAADAVAQEEMARDRRRWDDDMVAVRHAREVHELATQHRHHRNLACRMVIRARKANSEGSNAIDPGWGDNLL
jgi:hypothetical protein